MSRFSPRGLLAAPLRALPRAGDGSEADMRSAKIWAKCSTKASNGCEERLGISELSRSRHGAQRRMLTSGEAAGPIDQLPLASQAALCGAELRPPRAAHATRESPFSARQGQLPRGSCSRAAKRTTSRPRDRSDSWGAPHASMNSPFMITLCPAEPDAPPNLSNFRTAAEPQAVAPPHGDRACRCERHRGW